MLHECFSHRISLIFLVFSDSDIVGKIRLILLGRRHTARHYFVEWTPSAAGIQGREWSGLAGWCVRMLLWDAKQVLGE